MKKTIHFTKMHGAGNDYIYIDATQHDIEHPEEAARLWSDRHTGIGADGLVLIGRPADKREADFSMRIFNADGSEALMCGNAARCVGLLVHEKGMTNQTVIRLETNSGIKRVQLHNDKDGCTENITVDMGEPSFNNPELFRHPLQETFLTPVERTEQDLNYSNLYSQIRDGVFVCMGNPHYVIFTNHVDRLDVAHWGRILEHDEAFPERCNIEFVQLTGIDELRVRVWERGSGITRACGTGACAAAVTACLTHRTGRNVRVFMDGGTLSIQWRPTDNHVFLVGTATIVFEGDIEAL